MRILYLCADPGIPVRGHKGAAVHVRAMCAAFERAGHAVTLIAARTGPGAGPAPAARLIVAEAAPGGDARAVADRVRECAAALLAEEPFDLIYERYALWSGAGADLARSTGLPFVLEVNAPLVEEARDHRGLGELDAARAIAHTQFKTATRLAVVSDALRDYVCDQGADPTRVSIVPNGVDPEHFHPAVMGTHIRRRLGLKGRKVVGFVGRPRPWHDLTTLIAAVERLHEADPAYALLLVGDMPDDLRAAAGQRPELITLVGALDHARVPAYIAAMDVAVSSHHARSDFYFSPLKLFEYLACGVPTVAADVGQQADVLRETNGGWLYPPGDAAALADRIGGIFAEPEEARATAWRGASAVLARYTWDANARRICATVEPQPIAPAAGATQTPLLDARLRARLYRASRPDLINAPLRQALGPDLTVTAIDVLKYKPRRRAVLRYHLSGARWPRVIGKVFRDDRAGRLCTIQRHLWENGFGPDAADNIRVAEPITVLPEQRIFVQELAPGSTLNELFDAGADLTPSVERAAMALAKLHRFAWHASWTPLGTYTLADEVAHLADYAADLSALQPERAVEVNEILNTLRLWAGQLPGAPRPRPIHRDFYYSQVLVAGPHLTLIDFDLISLGDPAIDAANFVAHLGFLGLERAGDAEALRPLADRFLDIYSRHAAPQPGFSDRLSFYTAATYFRLMNVVAGRPALAPLREPLQRLTLQSLLPV